jgi:uncharacterized protein (DUF2141 family)
MAIGYGGLWLGAALVAFASAGGGSEEPASTGATVRIGGLVTFKKNGPLFLRLIDLDEAKRERVVREQVIEIQADGLARGSLRYEFAGLAPGRYAVKCFQDRNGNKKIDIGLFGPKEPWATYRLARPKMRAPRFEEMAFEAWTDVLDADLVMR